MFRLQCQVMDSVSSADSSLSYEDLLVSAAPEVSEAMARRVLEALEAAGIDVVLGYDSDTRDPQRKVYQVEMADDDYFLSATFLQHQALVDAETDDDLDLSPDEAFGLLRTFLRTIEQVTGWRCLDWDDIEEQYQIALSE